MNILKKIRAELAGSSIDGYPSIQRVIKMIDDYAFGLEVGKTYNIIWDGESYSAQFLYFNYKTGQLTFNNLDELPQYNSLIIDNKENIKIIP